MNRTRLSLALAGVITGLAGLAASQATVWLLQAKNGPIEAVASLVRDHTPGGIAHWLIERVGHADKPLLLGGTGTVLLLLCAWVGTQSVRRPLLPDITYCVLGLVGLASVMRLDDSTTGSSLAVVIGLVTWIVVHRVLTSPFSPEAVDADQAVARRAFLRRAGGVTVVAAGVGAVGMFSHRKRNRVEKGRRLLRLSGQRGAAPAGSTLPVDGIEPWRTPNRDFYLIDTTFSPPLIPVEDWSLRIHGLVDREITLTYADLARRTQTADWITLCCVSNEVGGDLIGNAYWSGVLVSGLLAEAGVKAGADAVLQTSDDGWTCGTPLVALTDDRNAMLALEMNGEPLPIEHGFPVRMVVPGLYGYVSATKWIREIEVTKFSEIDAYWTQRGWSEKGPVLTQSRVDVPRQGDDVASGTLRIGGSAWAQHTGVERVEYQLDGGAWQPADLGATPGLDTWVQWKGQVEVGSGDHTLVVRATDRSGYTQTGVRTDTIPSGATGWHTIDFQAR